MKSLLRYLTKACTDDRIEPRKKFFGGSKRAKVGNVLFKWLPEYEPGAYLYHYGLQVWKDLARMESDRMSNARRKLLGQKPVRMWPSFYDVSDIIRLGVEATGWLEIDPWWTPRFT
jgi:hypothetical protein